MTSPFLAPIKEKPLTLMVRLWHRPEGYALKLNSCEQLSPCPSSSWDLLEYHEALKEARQTYSPMSFMRQLYQTALTGEPASIF